MADPQDAAARLAPFAGNDLPSYQDPISRAIGQLMVHSAADVGQPFLDMYNAQSPGQFLAGAGGAMLGMAAPMGAKGAAKVGEGLEQILKEAAGPRIVSSPTMQRAVLKNSWARHGPDLDYEEFWDKKPGVWEKEIADWNQTHGTSIDPKTTPFNSSTSEFRDYFDNKYLAGKKAAFPGVDSANEFFENNDMPEHGAYLSAEDAPE